MMHGQKNIKKQYRIYEWSLIYDVSKIYLLPHWFSQNSQLHRGRAWTFAQYF